MSLLDTLLGRPSRRALAVELTEIDVLIDESAVVLEDSLNDLADAEWRATVYGSAMKVPGVAPSLTIAKWAISSEAFLALAS